MHKNPLTDTDIQLIKQKKWTCKIGIEEFTQSLKNFIAATMWINECLLLYLQFIPSPTSASNYTQVHLQNEHCPKPTKFTSEIHFSPISLPKYIKFSCVILTFTTCTCTYHYAQVSFLIISLQLSQL